MKLIPYRPGDVSIRHSMVRLLGHEGVTATDVHMYLQNEKALFRDKSEPIMSADRCCLYIENFRQKRTSINSEHFLITLVAVFPHNFVARNYLATGYTQHLSGLKELLVRNIAKSIPPFEGAKVVIDYFQKNRMIVDDGINIYILLYNLLICHTQYFMVLEDTDIVDTTLMRDFLREIGRHG